MRRAPTPSGESPGVFIVLEGIDGSGKTEQASRLAGWLRQTCTAPVVQTREPTDGQWGRRYRAWARGEIEASPDEVLEFFVRDRREHVDRRIVPALARGDVVVCDRYVYSTLAYQGAHGRDRDKVEGSLAEQAFPEPDLVLWLRLPVERAIERMGPTATERYEQADFLTRVDAEYARLVDEGWNLFELDAAGELEEVTERVRGVVIAKLSDRLVLQVR